MDRSAAAVPATHRPHGSTLAILGLVLARVARRFARKRLDLHTALTPSLSERSQRQLKGTVEMQRQRSHFDKLNVSAIERPSQKALTLSLSKGPCLLKDSSISTRRSP